jgi:hypothetical protein
VKCDLNQVIYHLWLKNSSWSKRKKENNNNNNSNNSNGRTKTHAQRHTQEKNIRVENKETTSKHDHSLLFFFLLYRRSEQ